MRKAILLFAMALALIAAMLVLAVSAAVFAPRQQAVTLGVASGDSAITRPSRGLAT